MVLVVSGDPGVREGKEWVPPLPWHTEETRWPGAGFRADNALHLPDTRPLPSVRVRDTRLTTGKPVAESFRLSPSPGLCWSLRLGT